MWERELEEAVRMAREAGRMLLELYGTDYEVAFKSRANPVTEADTRANAYLVHELTSLFPHDGVVAEETEEAIAARSGSRYWYVDPLDGTKEFIARNGEFSVMIGLAIEGEARLGVVYQPVKDKLYAGVVGERAFLIERGEQRTLSVCEHASASDLRLVVSRSHRSRHIDALIERLKIQHETQSGSVGLKVGLIAEQLADVYVHFSRRSCAWDACGPEAVLRAAGGCFTDLSGAPFEYNARDIPNRKGILASTAAAYPLVLEAAQAIARDGGLVD